MVTNTSPQAEAYKQGNKRNMPATSLEYQYASSSNSNVNNIGISKGGGFFPNLRTGKGPNGVISQTRENTLAQNGSNSVFPITTNGGIPKQSRMLALPILNEQNSSEDLA